MDVRLARFNLSICCGICALLWSLNSQALGFGYSVSHVSPKMANPTTGDEFVRYTLKYNGAASKAQLAKMDLPVNKSLTVPYKASRVGKLALSLGKRTWVGLALTAALAGLDWYLKDGQPMHTVLKKPDDWVKGKVWIAEWDGVKYYGHTAREAADNLCSGDNIFSYISGSAYYYHTEAKPYNSTCSVVPRQYDCPAMSTISACEFDPQGDEVVEPITEEDYPELAKELANQQLADLADLYEDENGHALQTEELQKAEDEWMQKLADAAPDLAFDPDTHSLTYTDPDTDEQTKVSPDTSTNEDGEETADQDEDEPKFCTYAQKLCDFIDWFEKDPDIPEKKDLPLQEIDADDYKKDFDSGLGSGSCPAPIQFKVGSGENKYDFTEACDATKNYIRPALLIFAYFTAAMVISGVKLRGV